ncbi:C39 family peptidase, partial [Patescibacteria group bacterium]|nr:C39 family peptidase [Patescibacteria group bacterium]
MPSKSRTEKFILDVPYCSQYLDVGDEYWKNRACGMACVKMVLDYYKKDSESLDDLIKEGIEKVGYCEYGWVHDVLVEMMKERGLEVFRKEYKSADYDEQKKIIEQAIKETINFLKKKRPVIISAVRNFSDEKKFHMVILTGFHANKNRVSGFYYHDPDSFSIEEGMHKFVPIGIFKKYWRKMSVYAK